MSKVGLQKENEFSKRVMLDGTCVGRIVAYEQIEGGSERWTFESPFHTPSFVYPLTAAHKMVLLQEMGYDVGAGDSVDVETAPRKAVWEKGHES